MPPSSASRVRPRRCCAGCISPAARRKAARSTACWARSRAASGWSARLAPAYREAATPAAAGSGKSFFLTRLLREVIFGESGLAGADEGLERRARRLRLLAYGAIATLALALAALWTSSFLANREFVAAAEAGAAAAKQELAKLGPPRAGDEAQLVRALNALRVLPGGYRDRQAGGASVPDAGLSQAGKIGAQALRAYRNALTDALFPRLALALENEIRQGLRSPRPEGLRDALAAYQSLYAGAENDRETGGGCRAAHLAAS